MQPGRQVGREGSIRAPIHVQSGIIFSDSWTMIMQSVWPFNFVYVGPAGRADGSVGRLGSTRWAGCTAQQQ